MKEYYVGRTHCACHPATCNCPEHTIYYGVKTYGSELYDIVHSTHFKKEVAEQFSRLLNLELNFRNILDCVCDIKLAEE